jgi:hypothetical protein
MYRLYGEAAKAKALFFVVHRNRDGQTAGASDRIRALIAENIRRSIRLSQYGELRRLFEQPLAAPSAPARDHHGDFPGIRAESRNQRV